MGGIGSGVRWWGAKKALADDLPALDIRLLARSGGLEPGTHTFEWPTPWGEPAAIGYTVEGDALTLAYRARTWVLGEWEDRQETVPIERTACSLGGARAWFACPGCGRRVALLYCHGGVFRCRDCHGLTYASTREAAHMRPLRQANRLRARLGGAPALGVYPPRPAWMGQREYLGTLWRIGELEAAYLEALGPLLDRLEERLGE